MKRDCVLNCVLYEGRERVKINLPGKRHKPMSFIAILAIRVNSTIAPFVPIKLVPEFTLD
jgi:hypothetical protein